MDKKYKASLPLRFLIHERVQILELDRKGIVTSIHHTCAGTRYEVRYFDNAEAREVYFLESELAEI